MVVVAEAAVMICYYTRRSTSRIVLSSFSFCRSHRASIEECIRYAWCFYTSLMVGLNATREALYHMMTVRE